jgi:2-(1,2-epoxy-1,2-dihydrophenyl)acetyl-CoA isomerase
MGKYDKLTTVKVEIQNNIAYLTFNRPTAMNTYNFTMSQELPDCIESLAEDSNIKVVVLRGADGIFMAGGDIEFLKQASSGSTESTISAIASLNETILAIQSMEKVVIAAVDGACAGAGISIMLAADLVYCAVGSKFNTAYVNLGLSPDGGMSYSLPRIVGHKKALELILLSKPFKAEDAFAMGIVNQVLAKENFSEQIEHIAQELAKKPQHAVVSIKNILRESSHNTLQQQLSLELENFVDCTKTKDFQIGVQAFLNKQVAEFGK